MKKTMRRAALMAGKVVPAGIGAVIGGVGNRAMGKSTITNARKAFGPAPVVWPADRHLVIDADPLTSIDPVKPQPPAKPQ